jgi:hypothetical protein
MAIVAGDIVFRISGGASETDPDNALGGAMSTVGGGIITDAAIDNLFDPVSGVEANDGDTEYRCIYVENAHGSLTLQNAKVWISTITPSTDSVIAIALAGEGLSVAAEVIGDEDTAPSGESFTETITEGTALSLGNIPASGYYGIWVRRTISAVASAYDTDGMILTVKGETAA